jgi:hypothetical protein
MHFLTFDKTRSQSSNGEMLTEAAAAAAAAEAAPFGLVGSTKLKNAKCLNSIFYPSPWCEEIASRRQT